MSEKRLHSETWVKTLLLLLGSIPLFTGISGILGWLFDKELLTSFGSGLIPMAPSTAILFITLSVLYAFVTKGAQSMVKRVVPVGLTILIILISASLLILSSLNIQPDLEHLNMKVTTDYDNSNIGHMSPVSALLFLTLSVSFLIIRFFKRTTFTIVIPTALSGFTVLLSLTFLTGYLLGKPLLYGMNIIPPALNTSFGFLALSIAFAIEAFLSEKLGIDALTEMNERFRNVFEHSAEGKSMIFPDGTFLVNRAFAEMLGYSIDELNEIKWKAATHPDDMEMSQKVMDQMILDRIDTTRFQKRYIHKDGQTVWVDLQAYLQRDDDGNLLYFITSASDITDSKAMQEQLVLAKEQAERSNQLKDAFIANMSHEIRTPLNAILGFTDLVHEELSQSGSDEYESYFNIIRTSGMRLMRTVDMILNASRLQVGAYETRPVQINLVRILDNLVSEYKLPAGNKGLYLDFHNQLDHPEILADEYCIIHAISNLIDNAIKYTSTGGITLDLFQADDKSIVLDVRDTGIGISEEFLTQIFHPFTQEETSFTREFEGIGLGLSIAHRMLEVTGSRLGVESTKGVGTTFTITFPVSFRRGEPVGSPVVETPEFLHSDKN